jgi:hypothetical protein
MPVIVVTRLRLKDQSYLNDFFTAAVALLEQAKGSAGILGADAMAETNGATWWSTTSWQDRDSMTSFVKTDPHASTMGKLDGWCDEATFVDWEQAGPELPLWQTAHDHIVKDGRSATLSDASPENATRAFPAPVPS